MELLNELSRLQEERGFLSPDDLEILAKKEDISLAKLLGTANFYEFFRFSPDEEGSRTEDLYPVMEKGVLLNPEKAWQGYRMALQNPDGIIDELKASGLLGRSGGGFPTGMKWVLTRDTAADRKYIICNADEGEPGTGKDRAILKENPVAVIEGMAIAGKAVGATVGILYLRGEYADLRAGIEAAIADAPLDDFEIRLIMGQGAYICGEETALIASIEGERPEPRLKPPYPGAEGLYGKPTVVNNVETFACVTLILREGAEYFRRYGTEDYPGPKLFTVLGCVKHPGVYELEPGITLGTLLEKAGGVPERKTVKAVLIGGGSGTVVKPQWEMVLTPEGCREKGASFGVASVRFISEEENLVELLRQFITFYAGESCGICTPCRVGLSRLAALLSAYEAGEAPCDILEKVQNLTRYIVENARCAMAPAAVTPVITALNNFREVLA